MLDEMRLDLVNEAALQARLSLTMPSAELSIAQSQALLSARDRDIEEATLLLKLSVPGAHATREELLFKPHQEHYRELEPL